MKTRLVALWEGLHESLWVVPTLMMVLAIGLSFGMLALDQAVNGTRPQGLAFIYAGGPEGARALLSAVAGSMITVAGVAFSVTVVALTLASQQFGPRLLRNFMRDRGNQIILGTFIATFIYCLLILRAVRGTDDGGFVPHLSVTVGLVLAVASLGVLIYFIHHVTLSIRAATIVAAVGQDLERAIERLFPSRIGAGPPTPEHEPFPAIPDDFDERSVGIPAGGSGYLQAIDGDALIEVALKQDIVLLVTNRPGHFVTAGATLCRAWPRERLMDSTVAEIGRAFILGDERTLIQDIEFPINQLVEVAVRALSPGTNDPFTAMSSIDRLGAALSRLADRGFPSPHRYDESGRLRLIVNPITFEGITEAAFNQIRQYGRGSAAVTIRLLETIGNIGERVHTEEARNALLNQAAMIERGSRESLPEEWDRLAVQKQFRVAVDGLTARPWHDRVVQSVMGDTPASRGAEGGRPS